MDSAKRLSRKSLEEIRAKVRKDYNDTNSLRLKMMLNPAHDRKKPLALPVELNMMLALFEMMGTLLDHIEVCEAEIDRLDPPMPLATDELSSK